MTNTLTVWQLKKMPLMQALTTIEDAVFRLELILENSIYKSVADKRNIRQSICRMKMKEKILLEL